MNITLEIKLQNKIWKHEFMYEIFSFQGVYIWNKISNYINMDVTAPVFKKQVNIFPKNNKLNLCYTK